MIAMADGALTHEQALFMLNDHVGEDVFVSLRMSTPDGGIAIFPPLQGRLDKRVLGESEGDVTPEAITQAKAIIAPMYVVGERHLGLPPLPGAVRRYEMGLEWVLAEGLTLRINWGGD
jgi:hypothetical protein